MSRGMHERHKRVSVGCGILIISDSRTIETDESGKTAKQLLAHDGQQVLIHEIVKNDKFQILSSLKRMLSDPKVEVVITSGGTGISHRDITVETITEIADKKMVGFGELFRRLSYDQIGEAAILSRAFGGVVQGKIVFCLPGSVNAVKVALEKIILPVLGHVLEEVKR